MDSPSIRALRLSAAPLLGALLALSAAQTTSCRRDASPTRGLLAATKRNDLVMMERLLGAGANVEIKERYTSRTPLHVAARRGYHRALSGVLRTRATAAARGGRTAGSGPAALQRLSPLFGGGKKGSKLVAVEKLIAQGRSLQIISETDFLKMKRAPK